MNRVLALFVALTAGSPHADRWAGVLMVGVIVSGKILVLRALAAAMGLVLLACGDTAEAESSLDEFPPPAPGLCLLAAGDCSTGGVPVPALAPEKDAGAPADALSNDRSGGAR